MAMPMNEIFYRGNEPPWLRNDQRPYGYTADFDYPTSGRTIPTYEFKVPMCCAKCEEKVREELSEMDGVCEILTDQVTKRVIVTGFFDPFQALKKMKRIKKKSQFWEGRTGVPILRHRGDRSSHQKIPRTRHHETVYRALPSQVSYNREPARISSSRFRNKYGSYDDEIPYSSLRPAMAPRARFHGSYNDEVSYDDEVSYSRLRPASANRTVYYPGSYDDEISCADLRPYRNKFYGAYDDDVSYYDLRPSSSHMAGYRHGGFSSSMPRSPALRFETIPPFAQEYETEFPMEDYDPFYAHY